jgi:hypothetical protein
LSTASLDFLSDDMGGAGVEVAVNAVSMKKVSKFN